MSKLKTLTLRFRVWLAVWLCKPTACVVVRVAPMVVLHNMAVQLGEYVEKSGALNDPRRIKAYKIITRLTRGMITSVQDILIGGPAAITGKGEAHVEEQAETQAA